jgi:hypothetical protein
MHECIYLVPNRDEARFVGKRLDRSFLPQVLQQICFFVLSDEQVYVAAVLHERTSPSLQQWARRILSECGDRCDPALTLAQLTGDCGRFSEVHLDRGGHFLAEET